MKRRIFPSILHSQPCSPVKYLSVSWRSAEVMGCVLNLSEVFLLSPGLRYCRGLRSLSLIPLHGAPLPARATSPTNSLLGPYEERDQQISVPKGKRKIQRGDRDRDRAFQKQWHRFENHNPVFFKYSNKTMQIYQWLTHAHV